jgi:ABC-type branched-subunit amino acid transport system ATPase component
VSAADPAVSVDGLVMRYGDKVAVDGLSLTVERQCSVSIPWATGGPSSPGSA